MMFCDVVDTIWHGHFATWLALSPSRWYFSFFCSKHFETHFNPFHSFFSTSSVPLMCPDVPDTWALSSEDVSLELHPWSPLPLNLKPLGLVWYIVGLSDGEDGSGVISCHCWLYVCQCTPFFLQLTHFNLLSTSQPWMTWPWQLLTSLIHFYWPPGTFCMYCLPILPSSGALEHLLAQHCPFISITGWFSSLPRPMIAVVFISVFVTGFQFN